MERLPWLFDELAHAGPEHLDPAYARAYDGKSQTDPTEDVALLRSLGLDRSSALLDFGAGTGTLALAAAPFCGRVVAIDVSAHMLARLRERASERNIGNIEVVQSGFLTYAHRGDPADFAYSRNALHHLPDFWKEIALRRVADALRPGGTLYLRDLVYSFDPGDAHDVIREWLANAPVNPEEGYTAMDLATHVRSEYSTYTWLLEPLIEHAGFEIRHAVYESDAFAAYICVKR